MRRPRPLAVVAIAVCASALVACSVAPPAPVVVPSLLPAVAPKDKDALRIDVINVASGNCVLIECPESVDSGPHALLDDCGSNHARTVAGHVAAYLRARLAGYGPHSVDILVSHPHADHYNLITALFAANDSMVGEVVVSGAAADYRQTGFAAFAARHPAAATLGPTATTRLAPCGALSPIVLAADLPGPPNAHSAVLWLRYAEFLMIDPGDAGSDTEARALDNLKASALAPAKPPRAGTWLLASHHGAATAGSNNSYWIAALQPRFVLVSAGDPSTYGHPNCAVVARYLAALPAESPNHRLACPPSESDWNHAIATTGNIFSTHDCGDLVVSYAPDSGQPVGLKVDAPCEIPTAATAPTAPSIPGS